MEQASKRPRLRSTQPLQVQADQFIANLEIASREPEKCGNFTPAIYDTAWVATITSPSSLHTQLLFPQCFQHLLKTQLDDGSWSSYASDVDGILNTASALLALLKRPVDMFVNTNMSINERISRGTAALGRMLQAWDLSNCDHVGYELLVPRTLGYLSAYGVDFEFPARSRLDKEYARKMEKFKPEYLYTEHRTTLLHSLEGLIGLVDFDKLSHHVSRTAGLMGSPSSTAAFLSQSSMWNENAEFYLRAVVGCRADGAVPSAFPTSIFEISWAMTTLCKNGFTFDYSENSNARKIVAFLQNQICIDGTAGFNSDVQSDVDDTAKVISALQAVGEDPELTGIISTFEGPDHFMTYPGESNPSFTANCNVLAALVGPNSLEVSLSSIVKVVNFLVATWNQGTIRDKWNLAPEYSYMSFTLPAIDLLILYDQSDTQLELQTLDGALDQMPIVLTQLLNRLVSSQRQQGDWRGSIEVTAYAAIALAKLSKLPWPDTIRADIQHALSRGREYLMNNDALWNTAEHLWIEKVSYGSPILTKSYCLAAIQAPSEQHPWRNSLPGKFAISKSGSRMLGLFQSLPLHVDTAPKLLRLAGLESSLFALRLRKIRLQIFHSRDSVMTDDKWLEFIPMAWVSANVKSELPLSALRMWEMMVLSMLNYQVDEYMETAVAVLSDEALEVVDAILKHRCRLPQTDALGMKVCSDSTRRGNPMSPTAYPQTTFNVTKQHPRSELYEIEKTLGAFISYVLNHWAVLQAPGSVVESVARELYRYLKAQIAHIKSNKQLKTASEPSLGSVTRTGQENGFRKVDPPLQRLPTYFDWVRTVGADDTSCPYSLAFFNCLTSTQGSSHLQDIELDYLNSSLTSNLAAMCRQYNDYGSISRDRAEGNLNSLHFTEFQVSRGSSLDFEDSKARLLYIADFEKELMNVALGRLAARIQDPQTVAALRTFVCVTDLFGQIYVARDIASRVKCKLEA